jgi:hypothetical protein
MSIASITSLSTIDIIENTIQRPFFFEELFIFIRDLISNCQIEYDEDLSEIEEYEIKNVFIDDIKNIIINLNMVLVKYFNKNLGKLISLDLENIWYSSEKTLLKNDILSTLVNPFIKNKTISKILTIVCKLIDFLNEYSITKIKTIDENIEYLKYRLKEIQLTHNFAEYEHMLKDFNKRIESREFLKNLYCDNFKEIHEISKPVQQYFINIFDSGFDNDYYFKYTPITVLNIFQSSLYFINNDYNFLKFIIKFKNWLPSEYRCKYGSTIMKLYFDKDLDINSKKILGKFNPNLSLIIDDIITIYWKSKSDPSLLGDILKLNCQFINFKNNIVWNELDNNKNILFLSIELSLISALKNKENITGDRYYEQILENELEIINHVLISNNNLFESYLIYNIPSVLLSLYDEHFSNPGILTHLNNIFRMYLSSKLGINYLSSMIEEEYIFKLPANTEQIEKFLKWFKYYKYISDNINDTGILDQISSTVLVIPYVLPMDTEFTLCDICDKNIIESCLWEKRENPFTRSFLTIDMLKELNGLEKNIELVKNTKIKLNAIIGDAKKIII